jgi:hypothetical protein
MTMRRISLALALALAGCGGKSDSGSTFPEDFGQIA